MDLDARKHAADLMTRTFERHALPFHDFEMRRVGDVYQFDGIASSTDSPYSMGFYQETIRSGAFAQTLSQSPDVQLLINHDGLPIARTGRNMTLSEDGSGLRVQADLNPSLPRVEEVALTANDGLIDQMSFAFRVLRQEWDDDYENREIIEVDLNRGDVSIVNQGANPATSFTMRDAQQLVSGLSRDEFAEFMRSITDDQLKANGIIASTGILGTVSGATALARSWSGPMSEHPRIVAACAEYRAAGATDDQMDALQNVLNLIDASDTNVDKALIALSAFMGVTNPDIAQDKALDRAARKLELAKARAFSLRLAAEAK